MSVSIQIDGVDMPNPVEFSPGRPPLNKDTTERVESGLLMLDFLRIIRRINIAWEGTRAEIKRVLDATEQTAAKPFFTCRYYDVKEGWTTKTFYASLGDAELVSPFVPDNPSASLWRISGQFIER